MFTPGDSIRKMKKVAQIGADAVILDLEDAVAIGQKEVARKSVESALANIDFGRAERLVRINSLETDLYASDLESIVGTAADGIVLPKVESAEQVRLVDQKISAGELSAGRPPGEMRLFGLIETALGVMNIREIGQSSQRLDGLLFGAEDLAADLGAIRSKVGWEVFYARSTVIAAATAYGLAAIDTVYLDFSDLDGLEEDALFARSLGFTGKLAIHPGQVAVLNRAFSPTAAEIAEAERLVEAYQARVKAGSGVFTIDGRMVDKPLVRAAERLLERAAAARLMDGQDYGSAMGLGN